MSTLMWLCRTGVSSLRSRRAAPPLMSAAASAPSNAHAGRFMAEATSLWGTKACSSQFSSGMTETRYIQRRGCFRVHPLQLRDAGLDPAFEMRAWSLWQASPHRGGRNLPACCQIQLRHNHAGVSAWSMVWFR